jgi:hypothetical protein
MTYLPIKQGVRESDGHPHFAQPLDRSARVWRYFSWPRFMQALQGRSLWFARADELKMKDPCEGSRTRSDAEAIAAVKEDAVRTGSRADWIRSMLAMRRFDDEARRSTFISCWQMQDHDMISMWERYCTPRALGVAVQTTYARLDAALPLEYGAYQHVMLGLMRYGDHRTDLGNPYSLFMTKKVHYADEHEVRLLFMSNGPVEQKGFQVPVDWPTLVEQIVVSPYGSDPFTAAVKHVCKRHGFTFPVVRSTARDVTSPFAF